MRPLDYPYDHEKILDVWLQFSKQKDFEHQKYPIDPLVLESWRRCVTRFEHQADSPYIFPQSSNQNERQREEMISVSLPYLEDIYQFTQGSSLLVTLTDNTGTVLALDGDPTVVSAIHRSGLGIGKSWAEDHIGTNAIGLALLVAMPTQVVGAEHYFQIYHDYADSAAPVHNDSGQIIGCVGIVTSSDEANMAQLALVMATSRAITNQIQSERMLQQANHRLKQLDMILETVADGIITWDAKGKVDHINSIACQLLGIRQSAFLGKPISTIMTLVPDLQKVIERQQELSNVEISLQIEDRIVKCMITTRTIPRGAEGAGGSIARLQPISHVRLLVSQQVGSQATLTFKNFESESSAMRQTLRQAEVAARGSAPVLLLGEGGVGKTALAQAIHNASPRVNKPLVVINCPAIPKELMLSELIGIEGHSGESGRPSKFELADGGTLLIDEIDHLSLEAQATLQQIINSRYVMRLHATRATPVNVRIIATSSIDIESQVENQSFLAQLYYRFNVFKLYIPPLRERHEDIQFIIERFLKRNSQDDSSYEVDEDVLKVIEQYPWPGNVRELEGVLERALLHCEDSTIRVTDLPQTIRTGRMLTPRSTIPQSVLSLEEAEIEAIIHAGWAYHGVMTDMADALGINRTTLWRKMKQYGINSSDFK